MEPFLPVLLSAVGVATAAGAAFAVFRTRGTRETIDLLEQSLRIERGERLATEARCNERIAHLEGRVVTLTDALARTIAVSVVKHLDELGKLPPAGRG